MRTPIYAQKLSADGSALVGERKLIIENDQPWEAHLVEGMWVTKQDNRYYLFYSGNDFSTEEYGIGVAIAGSPTGPFTKSREPILRSTKNWRAPGHPSVAVGPDGKYYLFMHAYYPGKAGYKEFRALLAAQVEFKNDKVIII
jgi:beta-xylosidase